MKSDLPYFTHDSDARNHPKLKALRARFGWEGYGRFWALNEMIAAADECKLDISRPLFRASFASDLGFSVSEFDDFVAYLADSAACGLVKLDGNIITTDRTQENYEYMKTKRKRDRLYYKSGKDSVDEKDVSASGISTEKNSVNGKVNSVSENGNSVHGPSTESIQRKGKKNKVKERGSKNPPAPFSETPRRIPPDDAPEKALAFLEPYHDRAQAFVNENQTELIRLAEQDGVETLLGALHVCVNSRIDKLRFFVDDYTGYRRKFLQARAESEKDFNATKQHLDRIRAEDEEAVEAYDETASLTAAFHDQVGDRSPPGEPETPADSPEEFDDFQDDIPWGEEENDADRQTG